MLNLWPGIQVDKGGCPSGSPIKKAGVDMSKIRLVSTRTVRPLRWLYHSEGAAWLWLVVRLWLGYKWIDAGWQKMFGAEYQSFWNGGTGIQGYVLGAKAHAAGAHASVVYGWWLSFLTNFVGPNHAALAKVVALGEFAVGVGLVLGLLTGAAAFFGVAFNFMYLFSGTVGVNPMYAIIGLFLVVAWQNAGMIGLDRWVLPLFVGARDKDEVSTGTMVPDTVEEIERRHLQRH